MADSHNKCSNVLEILISKLDDGGFHEIHLEKLIHDHPECETELRSYFQTWMDLDLIEIPQPSETMHTRFYKTLAEEQSNQKKLISVGDIANSIKNWLGNLNAYVQWVLVAGVFLAGMIVGKFAFNNDSSSPFLVAEQIKPSELLYAGLNDKISASERLLGIQRINQMKKPDEKVLEALYQVLTNDPNTNVRISAIETLVNFAHLPNVRQMLIRAISKQESPLVQLALAEAMMTLQEKDSANEWKKLLSSDHVEVDVKHHLEETLETILY